MSNKIKFTPIPSTSIKGKEYTEVKDRVVYFRNEYPKYSLVAIPVTLDEKVAIFRAEVTDEQGKVISNGYAMETANNGMVNKTNHIENAETSAKGRALGFLGIGIVGGIATVEDIKTIDDEQIEELQELMKQKGSDKMALLSHFKISTLKEMDRNMYITAIEMLNKKKSVKNG